VNNPLNPLLELLWAFVGLFLTIFGTMIEASLTSPLSGWGDSGSMVLSLGVTYQVGAILLVGCLGGKNAGALSQIAYLTLGLTPWFPVFSQGGGWDYTSQPIFGYLLGFVPGAWVCGWIAFRSRRQLETLALGCFAGLLTIHATGWLYAVILRLSSDKFWAIVWTYSVTAIPGQVAIACAAATIAYVIRRVLFY
jgi:biotin transport system substrate-specific component